MLRRPLQSFNQRHVYVECTHLQHRESLSRIREPLTGSVMEGWRAVQLTSALEWLKRGSRYRSSAPHPALCPATVGERAVTQEENCCGGADQSARMLGQLTPRGLWKSPEVYREPEYTHARALRQSPNEGRRPAALRTSHGTTSPARPAAHPPWEALRSAPMAATILLHPPRGGGASVRGRDVARGAALCGTGAIARPTPPPSHSTPRQRLWRPAGPRCCA